MTALKKIQPANVIEWPTSKSERFKYTNLAAAVKGFSAPTENGVLTFSGDTDFVKKMAFSNAPQWVKDAFAAGPVGEEKYRDMVLWEAAKNAATEVYVVDVPAKAGVQLNATVQGSPFLFVRIGRGGKLTFVETRRETGKTWANAVAHIFVEDNARMRHVRIQENGADTV